MAKVFYNSLECNKLVKLINMNPEQARMGFEEYLEKYPYDYYARCMYASVLITLQQFELAEEVINDTLISNSKNSHLANRVEKRMLNEKDIFYNTVRLLSYTGRFEKLYEYIFMHQALLEKLKMRDLLSLYCQKKLGILNLKRDDLRSYVYKQIVDYKESDMIDHIKDHIADYSITMDNPDLSIFSPDFPIDSILQEIKKYIPSDKKLCSGLISDIYYFRYDGCGKDNNRFTNCFKVVCFHDTGDIITMCPAYVCESLACFDLNYLNQNNNLNSKVKTISQRDKFYRRYGNV